MKAKNKKLESKIKVDHNLDEVTEGVDYIMTIKDQNVLDVNENDIDTLENEVLNINKNMKLSEKLILDKEQDQYLKDQILSKYDENKQEGFIIKNSDNARKGFSKAYQPTLDLNENEENDKEEDNKNEINSIKEKLKELKAKNKSNTVNKIELLVDKKFESDYLTHEEFKPKEFKKKKFTKKIQLKSSDLENENETNQNAKKNNSLGEVDDYNELENFLEKQRNLINKEKSKIPEEEKLKIVNNPYQNKEEKENNNKINDSINKEIKKNEKIEDNNSSKKGKIYFKI